MGVCCSFLCPRPSLLIGWIVSKVMELADSMMLKRGCSLGKMGVYLYYISSFKVFKKGTLQWCNSQSRFLLLILRVFLDGAFSLHHSPFATFFVCWQLNFQTWKSPHTAELGEEVLAAEAWMVHSHLSFPLTMQAPWRHWRCGYHGWYGTSPSPLLNFTSSVTPYHNSFTAFSSPSCCHSSFSARYCRIIKRDAEHSRKWHPVGRWGKGAADDLGHAL